LGFIALAIVSCLGMANVVPRARKHYRQPSRGPPLSLS